MYAKYFKRMFDFTLSLLALLVLSPLLIALIIVGSVAMKGNPFFAQLRPGKNEKIFKLIKFRTMTCETDVFGNFLPDENRLTTYGKWLRSTSLDELPELWNIVKGDMSIVGPRPQLVRDMVFMTPAQRRRHTVRQGLTGLAQVCGRNDISWEKKLELDLLYIDNITFVGDVKIMAKTVVDVFRRDGITQDDMATAMDLGDWLLEKGELLQETYDMGQQEAKKILETIG